MTEFKQSKGLLGEAFPAGGRKARTVRFGQDQGRNLLNISDVCAGLVCSVVGGVQGKSAKKALMGGAECLVYSSVSRMLNAWIPEQDTPEKWKDNREYVVAFGLATAVEMLLMKKSLGGAVEKAGGIATAVMLGDYTATYSPKGGDMVLL